MKALQRSTNKASRKRNSENGTSWIRTTETSWWRTTETSFGVSFQTCLRRRGDVLMGRRCYILLRRWRNVPIRCRGDVLLRRIADVLQERSFETYMQHRWDIQKGVVATSLRRLLAGLDVANSNIKITIRSQELTMAHQILSKMRLRIGMLAVFLLI